jgi:hypothetical protein
MDIDHSKAYQEIKHRLGKEEADKLVIDYWVDLKGEGHDQSDRRPIRIPS